MATNIYRGFSTRDWQNRQSFTMRDLELVKRDLLNHIFTLRGERVMMPNFGTRIPLLAFEPNDEQTREIVREDLTTVFTYDPRVQLLGLTINSLPDNNAIVATAQLLYVEFQVRDELRIEVSTQ